MTEFGRVGILVNNAGVGWAMPASRETDQFEEDYISSKVMPRVLVGRLGHSEELAAALVFLASEAGGDVTGTTLPIEGGLLTGG
jgi:NAD(P)-dependent dehydrogenase (short-subunit alcohol dehydrogenase family)